VKPLASNGEEQEGQATTTATTDRGNFTILQSIANPTAKVDNKTYDGNTNAKVVSWSAIANNTIKLDKDTAGFDAVFVISGLFNTSEVGENKPVTVTAKFKQTPDERSYPSNYALIPVAYTTANITQAVTTTTIGNGTLQKRTITTIYPITHPGGSPAVISEDVIAATGTVENIAAGTYNVSIISTSNPSGAGTIVVANGSFYVSLNAKTFNSNESVTVTITSAGTYSGKSFTFNTPTIAATFGNASSGSGTVMFSGLGAFNGETASLTSSVTEITGYSSITAIANGEFTANYNTLASPGSIITPEGTINIDGTGFTFTSTATVN